jgi:predicted HicB family RNase H-like nuclease
MMNDILQYNGYYAEIHLSSDDDVFYGKLLGISDLVSFEGASVSGLKQAFHEAVEDYLETCADLGKDPEKTYKGSFNVRISPELHRKAATLASMHKVTLNELVKQAIDGMVSKRQFLASVGKGVIDK